MHGLTNFKLLILSFLYVSLYACNNIESIPQKVNLAFLEKFPNINTVEWEKESDTEWEAEFEIEGLVYSANFAIDGIWIETEHQIMEADIPTNIINTIHNSFFTYKIEKIEMSETKEGIFYEFEMMSEENELELTYNTQAQLVKKEIYR